MIQGAQQEGVLGFGRFEHKKQNIQHKQTTFFLIRANNLKFCHLQFLIRTNNPKLSKKLSLDLTPKLITHCISLIQSVVESLLIANRRKAFQNFIAFQNFVHDILFAPGFIAGQQMFTVQFKPGSKDPSHQVTFCNVFATSLGAFGAVQRYIYSTIHTVLRKARRTQLTTNKYARTLRKDDKKIIAQNK